MGEFHSPDKFTQNPQIGSDISVGFCRRLNDKSHIFAAVYNIGAGILTLKDRGEHYRVHFPDAYAR